MSTTAAPPTVSFVVIAFNEEANIADCLASLDWSTAAMLSARFAIVTPTGGLPAEAPCDGATGAQFLKTLKLMLENPLALVF
mgnify:CR=1 FL=1